MTDEQQSAIVELLWDYLKKDPEHKDRRQTGWGTKTKVGLCACIERIWDGRAPTLTDHLYAQLKEAEREG